MIIPIIVFAVVKNGLTSGSPANTTTFQSNVGNGFKPNPPMDPVTAARRTFSGEE